jgi:hypothetical protein
VRMILAAARVMLHLGARRAEIERLFARTAAAFGCPVPPSRARNATARLGEYALFTRSQAEAAHGGCDDIGALERRLFGASRDMGNGYRLRLGLHDFADAMAAARLVYAGLGIDFRVDSKGCVVIRRCAFAAVYTPAVCTLMSALDRGLIAGLTGGGMLSFQQRLTEGAAACQGCVTKEKA